MIPVCPCVIRFVFCDLPSDNAELPFFFAAFINIHAYSYTVHLSSDEWLQPFSQLLIPYLKYLALESLEGVIIRWEFKYCINHAWRCRQLIEVWGLHVSPVKDQSIHAAFFVEGLLVGEQYAIFRNQRGRGKWESLLKKLNRIIKIIQCLVLVDFCC